MRSFCVVRIGRVLLLALACFVVAACNDDGNATEPGNGPPPPPPPAPAPPPPGGEPRLERIAEGLQFPVHLTAPAGDARLFIVEKGGLGH